MKYEALKHYAAHLLSEIISVITALVLLTGIFQFTPQPVYAGAYRTGQF
jgi:hypothetical protein